MGSFGGGICVGFVEIRVEYSDVYRVGFCGEVVRYDFFGKWFIFCFYEVVVLERLEYCIVRF